MLSRTRLIVPLYQSEDTALSAIVPEIGVADPAEPLAPTDRRPRPPGAQPKVDEVLMAW